MKAACGRFVARIDALSRRDRTTLALGLVAVVLGLEFGVLLPMASQRQALARAQHEQARADAEARQAEQQSLRQRLDDLTRQQTQIDGQLAALGVHQLRQDALADFVRRAMQGQGAVMTGLKALAIEPIEVAAAASPEPAADDGSDESAAPGEVAVPAALAAKPALKLYRHRVELLLEGSAHGLAQAVGRLEHELKPLRIEHVQLKAEPDQAGPVRARLVLTTISRDRTWLAL